MRVSGDWIANPATQAVCAALAAGGFRALFVGGCVRNALLGAPIADVDIATDARPDIVTVLAEKAGFKVVPTGIDHGTVTVVRGLVSNIGKLVHSESMLCYEVMVCWTRGR